MQFRNRVYYALKPFLPWRLRIAVRRFFARRSRAGFRDVWPIYEPAGRRPENWRGWPDGKQFAFVLTHDVEGVEGLKKVRQLAELEMSLGFRSCFNFVPQGDYQVPTELRHWLLSQGFEVGVHDLKHDGRLFRHFPHFLEHAQQINAHLKEWDAKGFRAGFMLRNLDWLHELKIQYDCSTFDVDPFEPQPDGVGTIFPFWVAAPTTRNSEIQKQNMGLLPRVECGARDSRLASSVCGFQPSIANSAGGGYVELPYSLPQDSTLFLLLGEDSPAIWIKKLDWIARHGGMALSNIHPDYIQFAGEPRAPRLYPVAHYVALLQHVRDFHAGHFWHVVPQQVAALIRRASLKVSLAAIAWPNEFTMIFN